MNRSRKIFAIVIVAASLAGCSAAKLQDAQMKGADYQAKIAAACATAMSLASVAPSVAPWIVRGCYGEAAVAKLALDPSSLAWLNDMIAHIKG